MLVIIFPFLWIVLSSFRGIDDFFSLELSNALPKTLDLTSYKLAFGRSQLVRWTANSLFIATGTTLLSLTVSAPAAFAIARLRFKGRRAGAVILISSYAIPSIMLAIPVFVLLTTLRLNNSYFALILLHATFTIPFTTWVLQDFYHSIPADLEEAGYIDGASLGQVLWRIILPLSVPGLLAAGAYAFIMSWTEFLFAFLLVQSNDAFTAPVGVHAFFTGRNAGESVMAQLMAASVVVSLPSVVIFAYFQRYLVSGFLTGAVKG
jgi:multiple sugar transport system permease protein